MRKGTIVLLLAALHLTAVGAAGQEMCIAVDDPSTEEVLPGVTLTWDSAFLCEDAPGTGTYQITVMVENHTVSAQDVVISELTLSHTTPRPLGQAPEATAVADELPLEIAPDQSGTFTVSGQYELVNTDEGMKANLHLRASGHAVQDGDPFHLGINVLLRGPGAAEDDDGDGNGNGPPEGVPIGPPEGAPLGPPEGVPTGPPEGVPPGPPEGVPSGPPQGAPSGRPSIGGRG